MFPFSSPDALALAFATGGGLASLVAAALILWKLHTPRAAILLVGFAAGALLGASLFDLLPKASAGMGLLSAAAYTVAGLVAFWIIEHALMRHHHYPQVQIRRHVSGPGAYEQKKRATAMLVLFGDTLHNFVDGVVIAATFLVSIPFGIITSLAVFFHEIPQELGDVAILLRAGMPRIRIIIYNFLSALVAVAGAALALIALETFQAITIPFLAFTAGGFLYISLFNLLPETYRQSKHHHAAPIAVVIGMLVILLFSLVFPA